MFDGCSLPLEYYYNYYNLIKSLQFKKNLKKKRGINTILYNSNSNNTAQIKVQLGPIPHYLD